jgi:hypothetical protein
MDEHKKTELHLSEEQLQHIMGGTYQDAKNWLLNLPDDHQRLFDYYKRGKLAKLTDENELSTAIKLGREYRRLRALNNKTLTDGSEASRVGQLRPKKS